jgi:hypothetical protein
LVLCIGLALVRRKHCVSTGISIFFLEFLLNPNMKNGAS